MTTAGFALALATAIVAVAVNGADVAIGLVLAVLFAYPGVIAIVRIFAMRRRRFRQQSP